MYNTLFSLAGSLLLLFSNNADVPFNEAEMIRLETHLPGVAVCINQKLPPDLIVEHREGNVFSYYQSSNEVVLTEPWNGTLSADFVHLLYGAARRHWLETGIFPVHSACVGTDEKGYVLIVGASGAGKTSTSLYCAQAKGQKIYSGDKTLIKISDDLSMLALGHTQVFSIRAENAGRWNSMVESSYDQSGRQVVKLKKKYLTQKEEVQIKAIAMIQLNEGNESLQELSPLSALHTLYPFFLDVERADVILGEGKALLDGNISLEAKTREVSKLAGSLKNIPAYRLTGSLDYVCSHIAEML